MVDAGLDGADSTEPASEASEAPDHAQDGVDGADSTGPVSEASEAPDHAQDGIGLKRSRGQSHVTRTVPCIGAFTRRGLTATVAVLALLTAVLVAYAFWILPDTTVPQPQRSRLEINFSPGHLARSPISVIISLGVEVLEPSNTKIESMGISLTDADLAHADWSIYMIVPAGVYLPPGTGKVAPYPGSNTLDTVVFNPGPQADKGYFPILQWPGLQSGPMQVHGANMAAWIPDVSVLDNRASASGPSYAAPLVPEPKVSTAWELSPPGADFTYLGGQSPDQLIDGAWTWKGAQPYRISNPINSPRRYSGFESPGVYVEGRSATADEQSNNTVFKSGIAFGVAAAALVAAIQEFVKTATDDERRARRKPSGHPAG